MTKQMIKAVFSNGHEDVYKGSRAVTAAWMITEKDTGRVINSGHSLDTDKAHKTAAGNIPRVASLPAGWTYLRNTISMYQYAKKRGFNSPSDMAADYARQNAKHAQKYLIEVINL